MRPWDMRVVLFEQVNRGQMRNFLRELQDRKPKNLSKHEVADQLVKELLKLSAERMDLEGKPHKAWSRRPADLRAKADVEPTPSARPGRWRRHGGLHPHRQLQRELSPSCSSLFKEVPSPLPAERLEIPTLKAVWASSNRPYYPISQPVRPRILSFL
jgi:hypothetical protein